jgi:hypothetical protein
MLNLQTVDADHPESMAAAGFFKTNLGFSFHQAIPKRKDANHHVFKK